MAFGVTMSSKMAIRGLKQLRKRDKGDADIIAELGKRLLSAGDRRGALGNAFRYRRALNPQSCISAGKRSDG